MPSTHTQLIARGALNAAIAAGIDKPEWLTDAEERHAKYAALAAEVNGARDRIEQAVLDGKNPSVKDVGLAALAAAGRGDYWLSADPVADAAHVHLDQLRAATDVAITDRATRLVELAHQLHDITDLHNADVSTLSPAQFEKYAEARRIAAALAPVAGCAALTDATPRFRYDLDPRTLAEYDAAGLDRRCRDPWTAARHGYRLRCYTSDQRADRSEQVREAQDDYLATQQKRRERAAFEGA